MMSYDIIFLSQINLLLLLFGEKRNTRLCNNNNVINDVLCTTHILMFVTG